MTHMTIKDAIKQSCTPEAPFFRFQRDSIYTFLWDDMTVPSSFDYIFDDIKENKDYKVISSSAMTKRSFLPWYNLEPGDKYHQAFCLEDTSDLEFLDLDRWEDGPTKPIQGILLSVSLPVLELLDTYYENGRLFDRFSLDVEVPSRPAPVKAYTWMTDFDAICVKNQTTQEFSLRPTVSACPFVDTGDYYAFGGA